MADPQAGYAEPEPQGLTGQLQRQIGPLQLWQWAAVAVGAFLLYKVLTRGDTPSATVPVPFTSSGDGSDGGGGGGTSGGGSSTPPAQSITKTLLYYKTKLANRTAIYDKAGHVVGHYAVGRTLILGKKVQIGGKWYYPIINLPGRFIRAYASVKVTPIYQANVLSTASESGPISAAIAAPATTLESSATKLYQPEPFPETSGITHVGFGGVSLQPIHSPVVPSPLVQRS